MRRRSRSGLSCSFGKSSQRYKVALAMFTTSLLSSVKGPVEPLFYIGHMAVARETPRWDRLFAERTRGEVGEGIAAVLAFLGRPDLISFAGGFPDPLTFPRERASALLAEFAAAGESAAFQSAPTRGLAGLLD